MNADVKHEASVARPTLVPSWDDELAATIRTPAAQWQEPGFRAFKYVWPGLLIGAVAGCVSLVVNVIGSTLWPAISGEAQHPLRLIQVYLTFPLGESALKLESGVVLALGCVLYIVTGMVYAALLVPALSYILPRAGTLARIAVCIVAALALWAVNFYVLLAWLQPALIGGRWIAELIPWWVAALTHVVFGVTIAVLYPITASTPMEPDTKNTQGGWKSSWQPSN
jgi:hypothetical protein